uniref:Ubiquitin carboxyl-terminal hydrolase 25 n=1 Tax=Lygus hesperus TaxID=30085 RepID=A0A0A9YL72_LYGHE
MTWYKQVSLCSPVTAHEQNGVICENLIANLGSRYPMKSPSMTDSASKIMRISHQRTQTRITKKLPKHPPTRSMKSMTRLQRKRKKKLLQICTPSRLMMR